jgi:hypothetical protein
MILNPNHTYIDVYFKYIIKYHIRINIFYKNNFYEIINIFA